jgi:hypothetical protein
MTETLEIEFRTDRLGDVPVVGKRKKVRVNGRPETLYVRSVNCTAKKWEPGVVEFVGTATLARDIWG